MLTKRYWIFAVVAVLPLLFLGSTPSFSGGVYDAETERVEAVVLNMPYGEARALILNAGWKPLENASSDELAFVSRAMYEQGYIEVDACAATGTAPCIFYFQNDAGEYLKVMTDGEHPIVTFTEMLDAEAFKALTAPSP